MERVVSVNIIKKLDTSGNVNNENELTVPLFLTSLTDSKRNKMGILSDINESLLIFILILIISRL